MKCPRCGYENREEVLCCGLCYEVLRRPNVALAQPMAAAAPPVPPVIKTGSDDILFEASLSESQMETLTMSPPVAPPLVAAASAPVPSTTRKFTPMAAVGKAAASLPPAQSLGTRKIMPPPKPAGEVLAERSMRPCKLHGSRPSVAICTSCGFNFCDTCLQESNGKQLCKNCYQRVTRIEKKGYRQKCIEICFNPVKFFDEMPIQADMNGPLKFIIHGYHIMWAFVGGLLLLVSILSGGRFFFGMFLGTVISLPFLLLYYVLALCAITIFTFAYSGIFYLFTALLGGKRGFQATFLVVANVMGAQSGMLVPCILLLFFIALLRSPALVGIVVVLVMLLFCYLQVIVVTYGLHKVHKLSIGKTVILGAMVLALQVGLFAAADTQRDHQSQHAKIISRLPRETILDVHDANFEQEVLNSRQPVLVEFWDAGSNPCQLVTPVVQELAAAYHGRLRVYMYDLGVSEQMADQYDVELVPTVLIFKDGKLVKRIRGAQRSISDNHVIIKGAIDEVLSD